jgi:hypothetical protein
MPNTVVENTDLWPEIKLTANTPERMLRHQANVLKKKSQGYLEAEVTKVVEDGKTTLFFDLIAPQLKRTRYRIFTATYSEFDDSYPTSVESAAIQDLYSDGDPDVTNTVSADDESHFGSIIKTILTSRRVQAKIESFIARTNEVLEAATMEATS